MPGSLTDVGEALTLDFINARAVTAPVAPLKLALTTDAPTDAAAGTEVAGGSYVRQNVAPSAAAGASPATASNDADVVFTDMPAVGAPGVVGWNIYDSSATPRRLWHGTFDTAKTTNAGDTLTVAAGALDLTQD